MPFFSFSIFLLVVFKDQGLDGVGVAALYREFASLLFAIDGDANERDDLIFCFVNFGFVIGVLDDLELFP